MMSYSNPTTVTHRVNAGALTAAASIGRFIGPKGLRGRLVSIASVLTTGLTVAAASIEIGVTADPNAYGSQSVPVSAINSVLNDIVVGVVEELPEDTEFLVTTDGGGTAGAADIEVVIDWY